MSIWGNWWIPVRKWFYPAWLCYETTYRFYDYALGTYEYVAQPSSQLLALLGSVATHGLALLCSTITFLICSAFLTVPACIILYHFFNTVDLTGTALEQKMKIIL